MAPARQEPVAIVGMGGWFPPGVDAHGLWRMVLARESASGPVPASRWGADPESLRDPSGARADSVLSTRACLLAELPEGPGDPGLALAARAGAMALSGLSLPAPARIGVVLGHIALPTKTSMARERREASAGLEALGAVVRDAGDPRDDAVNPAFAPARALAASVGARGACLTLDAACASTYYALALGMGELARGRADLVLAGGVSCPDPLYTQTGFSRLRALSPSGRCSPFDGRADGLVVGEGAGVFALRRLSDAVARGEKILGVIVAAGLSNDPAGHLLTPSSAGQTDAMRRAHARAGWSPDMIDYVECHAPGTPLGDRVEFASLKEVWSGAPAGTCVLGSVKANVGHMLTAAGAPALAKVLMAVSECVLPPATGFESAAPGIPLEGSPFRLPTAPEEWRRRGPGVPRRAALSGFGFGGVNAHLLVEEHLSGGVAVAFDRVSPPTLAVLGKERLVAGDSLPEAFHQSIPPTELEGMLPQQAVAWQAASRLLARLEASGPLPERTGVYLGAGLDPRASRFHLRHLVPPADRDHAHPPLDAERTLGALVSLAPSRISREFRLTGPSITISAGPLSGVAALQAAVDALEGGEVDLALVGAVEADESHGPPRAVAMAVAGLQAAAKAGRSPVAILKGVACEGGPDPSGAQVCQAVESALAPCETHPGTVQAWLVADGPEIEQALVELLAPRTRRDGVATARRKIATGAPDHAAGLECVVEIIGCLESNRLPAGGPPGIRPSPLADPGDGDAWLRTSPMEPRTGGACLMDRHAGCAAVLVEESSAAPTPAEASGLPLRAFEADGADELAALMEASDGSGPGRGAANPAARLGLALVPRPGESVSELRRAVAAYVRQGGAESLATLSARFEGRAFSSPEPLGGRIALVFPGSGSAFAGMGRALARAFPAIAAEDLDLEIVRPDIFWRGSPDAVAGATPCQKILAQVGLGRLTARVLDRLGVPWSATLGYSLGESTQLVAADIWPDLEGLRQDLLLSSLFTHDLVEPWRAARIHFRLRPDDDFRWANALLLADASEALRSLAGQDRVFLLASLAPGECVVGGEVRALAAWLAPFIGRFTPLADSTAGHCSAARPCADAYRQLHHRHGQKRPGVDVYFTATGRSEPHDPAGLADALTRGILEPLDLPRVVNRMHDEGARLFLEAGPGTGMSRWIGKTLAGKPHATAAIHPPGRDDLAPLAQALALLVAHRCGWTWPGTPEPGAAPPPRRHAAGPRPAPLFAGRRRQAAPAPEPAWPVSTPAPRPVPVSTPATRPVAAESAPAVAQGEPAAAWDRWPEAMAATREAHGAWLEAHAGALDRLSRLGALAARQPEPDAPGAVMATMEAGALPDVRRSMTWEQCVSFARGSVAHAMGSRFAPVDGYPSRVRLPDEPLLLVHRVTRIEGEPCSMSHGRVVTEHDVREGAWYLDQGAIPLAVSVEAGQADMLLAGWLGIDFKTRGLAYYRLLDAEITFHDRRPGPGSTIVYDISVDKFFRHGETHLFRFRYDATVDGKPLLSMREGCAGFFTPAELAGGKGLVMPAAKSVDASLAPPVPAPPGAGSLDARQVAALRAGDFAGAFGAAFANLPPLRAPRLPGGRLALLDTVPAIDPAGGAHGLGFIAAELAISADDWHMVCHFVDDRVMPGTLMYEACAQTLRLLMWRWGWLGEEGSWTAEPTPGITSRLRCRGQVVPGCRVLRYEITVTGRSLEPAPSALADAILLIDGKPIVSVENLAVTFNGLSGSAISALWRAGDAAPPGPAATYSRGRILAYCVGKPSEAFGEPYRIFDSGRVIARLPGPPFLFLDRIEAVEAEPWKLLPGARARGAYDVPADPWYIAESGQPEVPFAVLLEAALQVCGWLAAHGGAALLSPVDVSFRNLGGSAVRHRRVVPGRGTLATTVTQTKVSRSAGMIILEYDLDTRLDGEPVYSGQTSFGFFPKEALARQVGLSDAKPWKPAPAEAPVFTPVPEGPGLPRDRWRMLDTYAWLPAGGPEGLGWLEGRVEVDPEAWFFKAHFYQDPVWPGSLGLEAFLQLVWYDCLRRWGPGTGDLVDGSPHRWVYRGQVTPGIRHVTVSAEITGRDESAREVEARGWLVVGDKVIYGMERFRLRWKPIVAEPAAMR